jgi:hypothetical protein
VIEPPWTLGTSPDIGAAIERTIIGKRAVVGVGGGRCIVGLTLKHCPNRAMEPTMQSVFAFAAVTIMLNSFPLQTQAGWEGAEWGMTPEEVSAAVPGVRVVRRGMLLSDARNQSVRDVELYSIRLEASYFYGPQGLTFIRFDVPFRRCTTLVDGLVAEHGQPTSVSDQTILKIITWEDPEAANRLVLLHSTAGICDLRIRSVEGRDSGV